jgi:hypothetical protein
MKDHLDALLMAVMPLFLNRETSKSISKLMQTSKNMVVTIAIRDFLKNTIS